MKLDRYIDLKNFKDKDKTKVSRWWKINSITTNLDEIYIYIYIIKADIDNNNTHTRNIKFKRRIQINKKNTSYILLNKRNNARRRSPHV